jgi:hypothetical protein
MRKQMLTLLSVILLSGLVFDKGVDAADSSSALLSLPIELVLNEQLTPVYDSIDGQHLYSAAPQVVKVDGAESGWDRKRTPAANWQAGLPRSGSHRKSYGTAGTMWILGMAPTG